MTLLPNPGKPGFYGVGLPGRVISCPPCLVLTSNRGYGKTVHMRRLVLADTVNKHLKDCLSDFLHNFELLHKTQSGFRAGHSCETALIHMIDSWLHAFDNGQMIGVVLVDFKKAFDLVDHQILLSKLEIYGIKDEALQWFKTYLTQGRQQVHVNNSKSDIG